MDDDFPTSSAPQYSVGQVVKYFDTYLKKDVTGVIVGKERPLGFNIYTVSSRYDGRESRMLTHNLLSVKGNNHDLGHANDQLHVPGMFIVVQFHTGGASGGVTNFAYIPESPETLIIVAMLCD